MPTPRSLSMLKLGPHSHSRQRWPENYERLVLFHREFGHTRVPEGWADDPKLAHWVSSVRGRAKAGTLLPEQRRELERLGFEFEIRSVEWAQMVDQLRRFNQLHGHTSVARWSKEFPALGVFVTNLRVRSRRSAGRRLSSQQRAQLDALGFDWKPRPVLERRLVELELYHRENKSLPARGPLALWVKRVMKSQISLEPSQVQRLEALGLDAPTKEKRERQRQEAAQKAERAWRAAGKPWPPPPPVPRDAVFRARFEQLQQFHAEFGHTRLTADHSLYEWVHSLRARRRAGELAKHQAAQLEALDFEFEPLEAAWAENFALLRRFHRRFGHCIVPRFWKEDPWLGPWVSTARRLRREGKLSPERVRALDQLGFTWNVHSSQWALSLAQLDAFTAKEGHLRLPAGRLRQFLGTVRSRYWAGTLSGSQVRDLKARGVDFERGSLHFDAKWDAAFERLRAFHRQHGHCDVPRLFAVDGLGLGFWVSHQRDAKAKGELAPARAKRLDALGFRWSGRPHAVHSPELDAAIEHYRAHGHWWLPPGPVRRWLEGIGPSSDPRVRTRLSVAGAPLSKEDWAWERTFAIAREGFTRRGHLTAAASSVLGRWLAAQRALALTGDLEADREARLAAIDALEEG